MIKVQVEITGDKETVKKLKKLGKNLGDWKPQLIKVGNFLEAFYRNPVFETQGGIFGLRWIALNPAYELRKRKKFGGRGILEATGAMRGDWKTKVTDNSVVVANMSKYAKYHHSDKPRKTKLPRRVMVNIDNERKEYIINIFKEGMVSKIREVTK